MVTKKIIKIVIISIIVIDKQKKMGYTGTIIENDLRITGRRVIPAGPQGKGTVAAVLL